MKGHVRIALALLVATASLASAQTVIHVDQNADLEPHDGSSWCQAYLELYEALAVAGSDTVIRVANGAYLPDPDGLGDPREATFQLANNVTIEGGYAGCNDGGNLRDIELYETTLSGDIGIPGVSADNSYHVTNGSDTDATAVLDGFTVSGGNADGTDSHEVGGGIVIHDGSPVLANCIFTHNSAAEHGAGMYVDQPPVDPRRDNPTPTLANCTFANNTAEGRGGGIYTFNGNLTLTDCTFASNSASMGGGVCTQDVQTLTRCLFNANSATDGGGMLSFFGRVELTDCTFTENTAGAEGGGIYCIEDPVLVNCTFGGNTASLSGGGIFHYNFGVEDPSPTLTNCVFGKNSAGADGGGMYSYNSSPTLTHCAFTGNTADYNSGAMKNYFSNPVLTSCTFSGNSAYGDAGAVGNYTTSSPVVTNCAFTGNWAGLRGGGMYNHDSSPTLANCTFAGNGAGTLGGGIYSDVPSPTLANCILWANTAPTGAQIGGDATVTYSCVQGSWSGEGNISTDPHFGGDFHIMSGSSCIDAGNNTTVPPGVVTDLHGLPRFYDDPATPDTGPGDAPIVDMGAYEYMVIVQAGSADLDGDGDVDLEDFTLFQQQFTGPQ